MEITKQQNKTSADKTSIGFDYQYLYFIYRALGLKPGDQIGYEVKDDVHLELNDGVEEFIQLKHSLQEGKDNTVINMTERDSDLWKSLYNWSVSINEREPDKRLDYLQDKKFILVTNKNNNNNNFFIKTKQLQKKEIELNDYKNYISSLEKSVDGESKSSKKLKKYIEYFRNQDDGVLEQFVKKLNVTLAFDDLINKIKDQILSAHIDNRKLDEIFELCIGNLSIWKYEKIKNHGKVMISFEDINKKIKHCFIYGRNAKLPRVIKNQIELPEKLEKQNFIKELVEIGDIEDDDETSIIQYTTFRLKIENLLQTWIEDNYITETQKNDFLKNVKSLWSIYHKSNHRKSKKEIKKNILKQDELNEILNDDDLKCLDDVRRLFLDLCDDEKLSIEESNGTFYSLSENKEIGWKLDWERVYK